MADFQHGYANGGVPRAAFRFEDFIRIVSIVVLILEGGILLLVVAGYLSRLFFPDEQYFELLAVGPFSRVRLLYLAALLPRIGGALAFALRRRWGAGLFLLGTLGQAAVLFILTQDTELMYDAVSRNDGDPDTAIVAVMAGMVINLLQGLKWIVLNMVPAFFMLWSALKRRD